MRRKRIFSTFISVRELKGVNRRWQYADKNLLTVVIFCVVFSFEFSFFHPGGKDREDPGGVSAPDTIRSSPIISF